MDAPNDICLRCAATGKTCCEIAHIPVTAGDVRRIAGAVGNDGDFHEMRPPPDDVAAMAEFDALWPRIMDPTGRVRVLRHRPGGGCRFLGPSGCVLAMEIRPLVCRLYPFDYNDKTIKGVFAPLCPYPERKNAPLLLALLGMNRDKAEEWRTSLYAEIDADKFSTLTAFRSDPPEGQPDFPDIQI